SPDTAPLPPSPARTSKSPPVAPRRAASASPPRRSALATVAQENSRSRPSMPAAEWREPCAASHNRRNLAGRVTESQACPHHDETDGGQGDAAGDVDRVVLLRRQRR